MSEPLSHPDKPREFRVRDLTFKVGEIYIDNAGNSYVVSSPSHERQLPELVDCESCIGSGKIREEGETPVQDRWRNCMDCTGTGKVPAASAPSTTPHKRVPAPQEQQKPVSGAEASAAQQHQCLTPAEAGADHIADAGKPIEAQNPAPQGIDPTLRPGVGAEAGPCPAVAGSTPDSAQHVRDLERLERELADANSAAAHYVRDEPDITPRRAIVRQAVEIERLKGELAATEACRLVELRAAEKAESQLAEANRKLQGYSVAFGPTLPSATRPLCGCVETYPQLVPGKVSHGPGCESAIAPNTIEAQQAARYRWLRNTSAWLAFQWYAGGKLHEHSRSTANGPNALDAKIDDLIRATDGSAEAPAAKLCQAPECQINKRCGWPDDCLRFNPGGPGY